MNSAGAIWPEHLSQVLWCLVFNLPADGAALQKCQLWVRMGLRDMGEAPKGAPITNPGHHHLPTDTALVPDKHIGLQRDGLINGSLDFISPAGYRLNRPRLR